MSSARAHKVRFGIVAVVVGCLVSIVLPANSAHAGPTVAEIEAQIQTIWNEAEPLIEKYNAVHEQYQKNRARQEQLQKQIEPLQREVDLGRQRVGVMAAAVYKGGRADAFSAVVTSGSPQQLAEQLAFLDVLSREQDHQLEGVSKSKADLDGQKAPIDALVAELAKQDADLAQHRKAIEAKLTELQKLRTQAYGSGGGTGSYRPWPCPSEYLPTNGYKAASFACKQAGIPYVWAAAGPNGYDCSGLTLAAWKQVGVYLPHNAAAQRRSMPYVSRANIQLGDLVFYYSNLHHVAIYVGNGKVMSAPTFGDHVRMVSMDVMPIHSIGRPG
ncbi:MAG: peptidoglycan DL-endopeptidase CwlO [Micromonosporaceae bacterium]|nr:peptidoglycan DL-endopeptidase CwlO [Micromonosporaceae bacterium]